MKSLLLGLASFLCLTALANPVTDALNDSWQRKIGSTQNAYAEVEVFETLSLLAAGQSSIVCGYSSPGVWASSSLRNMLKTIGTKFGQALETSAPSIYADSVVCVTVSPKK